MQETAELSDTKSGDELKSEVGLPRLEVLAERLHLDAFEKRMILLLIGKTVSPVVKALIDSVDQVNYTKCCIVLMDM